MKNEHKLFHVTLATEGAKVELLFNGAGKMLAKKENGKNANFKKLEFAT